jgi:hypothetical protein
MAGMGVWEKCQECQEWEDTIMNMNQDATMMSNNKEIWMIF